MPPLHLTYDWTPGRRIDPHWLFEVDFSLLSDGGHDSPTFFNETKAQGTNRGFTFARATGATVQTGASSVISGLAANAARVGSHDGSKRGLVLEPSRINGLAAYARSINFFGPAPSDGDRHHYAQPGSVTLNAGVGPDGQSKATALSIVRGDTGSIFPIFNALDGSTVFLRPTYGPYLEIDSHINAPLNLSIWLKSTDQQHITWAPRNPWDANGYAYTPIELATVGSGAWQRVSLQKDAAAATRVMLCLLNGSTLASQGGVAFGAGPISGLYDLAQLEQDAWSGEVILTSDGISGGDRTTYAHGNDLALAGRLRIYFAFYPKHMPNETVSYSTDIASNVLVGDETLFSWTDVATSRRIFGGLHHATSRGKLHLRDKETIDVTSNEAITWAARRDFVEVFIECGGGIATAAKYRSRTRRSDAAPAWTPLTFSGGGALTTMAPATLTDMQFGWDGSTDQNTGALVLVEVAAYDAVGGPQ